ncbi:unnamed protein product, partial [Heterotrigona itama]
MPNVAVDYDYTSCLCSVNYYCTFVVVSVDGLDERSLPIYRWFND